MIYDSTFLVALERRKTRTAALAFFAQHQDEPLVSRDTDFQKVIAAGLPLRVLSF